MSNDATQAAGHVKAAIALAQQGKLESATNSLRAALALEFDIELADCIGRVDGLPEGTPVDLAEFLPSWRDEVFGDEDAFEIVVEGFDDDGSLRQPGPVGQPAAQDDFSDLADDGFSLSGFGVEAPSAREQDQVPTVPVDTSEAAAAARAGALARARYVGVAPPPPPHRRGAANEADAAHEQVTGSYSAVPEAAAWTESTEPGAHSAKPSAGYGGISGLGDPFDGDGVDLGAQTALPPGVEEAASPAVAPPVEAWADEPSVRRPMPPDPVLSSPPQATPDWATPLPPPVRPAEPVSEPALDVTPAPSYYDPLRDTPAAGAAPADVGGGFGVVRNSSVRKSRTPTEQAPLAQTAASSPPRRIDDLLSEAVLLMRRGDLAQADAAVERVLEREPRNAEALNLRSGLRKQLAGVRMRALEPLDRIPRQNLRAIMSSGAALTPRRMFFLNLVDGTLTLRDIIDISGASPDEAGELLLGLIDDGLILLR